MFRSSVRRTSSDGSPFAAIIVTMGHPHPDGSLPGSAALLPVLDRMLEMRAHLLRGEITPASMLVKIHDFAAGAVAQIVEPRCYFRVEVYLLGLAFCGEGRVAGWMEGQKEACID